MESTTPTNTSVPRPPKISKAKDSTNRPTEAKIIPDGGSLAMDRSERRG